jgi:hypothetical protein
MRSIPQRQSQRRPIEPTNHTNDTAKSSKGSALLSLSPSPPVDKKSGGKHVRVLAPDDETDEPEVVLFTAKSSETITQRVFNEDEDSEDDEENDPDYDSDVLSDSEESDSDSDNYENEDEEEEGEESAEDDEGNVWENDEAYVNFLNALLSDDVILEDDDEEYKPDDAKEEDETLDADEIYHEGTGRLAKHELIELVDGCLQTIAGEAPVVPAGVETTGNIALTEGGNATRSPGKHTQSSSRASVSKSSSPSKTQRALFQSDTTGVADNEWRSGPSVSMMDYSHAKNSDNRAGVTFVSVEKGTGSPPKSPSNSKTATTIDQSQSAASADATKAKPPSGSSSSSMMSRIANQIFTDNRAEICVDGMPVEVIRRLVARQMSMAAQLLMQVMILSSDDSECHGQCVEWLADINAHRDASVRKATLMAHSVKQLLTVPPSIQTQRAGVGYSAGTVAVGGDRGQSPLSIDGDNSNLSAGSGLSALLASDPSLSKGAAAAMLLNARITRSIMKRSFGGSRLSHRHCSSSVLDLPMLNCLTESLELLRTVRMDTQHHIKQSLERFATAAGAVPLSPTKRGRSARLNNSSNSSSTSTSYGYEHSINPNNSTPPTIDTFIKTAYETALLQLRAQMGHLAARTGMRCWECLIPKPHYPLALDYYNEAMSRICASYGQPQNPSTNNRVAVSFQSTMASQLCLENADFQQLLITRLNSMQISDQQHISNFIASYDNGNHTNNESAEEKEAAFVNTLIDFTPAESDLLLRGLMAFKAWNKIVDSLMPNRTEKEIAGHFNAMVSLSAPEANQFKLYMKLETDKKNNSVWTHAEDLELLRGFQVFGSKWALYHLFFLPHKRKSLIKLRWAAFQKMTLSTDSDPNTNTGAVTSSTSTHTNTKSDANANANTNANSQGNTTTAAVHHKKSVVSQLSSGSEIFLNILKTIDRSDPSIGVDAQGTQYNMLLKLPSTTNNNNSSSSSSASQSQLPAASSQAMAFGHGQQNRVLMLAQAAAALEKGHPHDPEAYDEDEMMEDDDEDNEDDIGTSLLKQEMRNRLAQQHQQQLLQQQQHYHQHHQNNHHNSSFGVEQADEDLLEDSDDEDDQLTIGNKSSHSSGHHVMSNNVANNNYNNSVKPNDRATVARTGPFPNQPVFHMPLNTTNRSQHYVSPTLAQTPNPTPNPTLMLPPTSSKPSSATTTARGPPVTRQRPAATASIPNAAIPINTVGGGVIDSHAAGNTNNSKKRAKTSPDSSTSIPSGGASNAVNMNMSSPYHAGGSRPAGTEPAAGSSSGVNRQTFSYVPLNGNRNSVITAPPVVTYNNGSYNSSNSQSSSSLKFFEYDDNQNRYQPILDPSVLSSAPTLATKAKHSSTGISPAPITSAPPPMPAFVPMPVLVQNMADYNRLLNAAYSTLGVPPPAPVTQADPLTSPGPGSVPSSSLVAPDKNLQPSMAAIGSPPPLAAAGMPLDAGSASSAAGQQALTPDLNLMAGLMGFNPLLFGMMPYLPFGYPPLGGMAPTVPSTSSSSVDPVGAAPDLSMLGAAGSAPAGVVPMTQPGLPPAGAYPYMFPPMNPYMLYPPPLPQLPPHGDTATASQLPPANAAAALGQGMNGLAGLAGLGAFGAGFYPPLMYPPQLMGGYPPPPTASSNIPSTSTAGASSASAAVNAST